MTLKHNLYFIHRRDFAFTETNSVHSWKCTVTFPHVCVSLCSPSKDFNLFKYFLYSPVKVWFFSFYIDACDRVQSEPTVECPAILIWPASDWRKGNTLKIENINLIHTKILNFTSILN